MAAKRARVPCGVGAGFWTARCSASKFDDAASARGRDLMMRTAGARIMSISGARRAQTSPGLPADAHDAGFWGAKMGGTTARCTNSRCPHLAQPLNYSGPYIRPRSPPPPRTPRPPQPPPPSPLPSFSLRPFFLRRDCLRRIHKLLNHQNVHPNNLSCAHTVVPNYTPIPKSVIPEPVVPRASFLIS